MATVKGLHAPWHLAVPLVGPQCSLEPALPTLAQWRLRPLPVRDTMVATRA